MKIKTKSGRTGGSKSCAIGKPREAIMQYREKNETREEEEKIKSRNRRK